LNTIVKNNSLAEKVFAVQEKDFQEVAIAVFQYQYVSNPVYRQYCNFLKVNPAQITSIAQIPFLPIRFFKSHTIAYGAQTAALYFESSGTSGSINSKHHIHDIAMYEASFNKALYHFYGDLNNTCIIGLLPNYLERQHSSLVYMVDALVKNSNHAPKFIAYNHHGNRWHEGQKERINQSGSTSTT
jgi:Acyl-protein synthetase, LuxE